MDVRIPKLRFKEFSAEWQQRHLSDISSIITGNTPSTSDRSLYGDEHLFVSPADMGNGRYVNETQTMLTQKGFDKTRKVPSGSTLFVCIGSTIGKLSQTAVDCATNQQINAVVPNTVIDPNFMYLSLERIASKIAILAGIQAVPIINKTDFSKNKIYLPNIQEQQKIADFLTAVDEKIAKLEAKKGQFEVYKKGVMRQIFSQKIRFKKNDGTNYPDWAEKRLGEIGDIYQPQTISQTDLTETGFPVYGANGIIGKYVKFNHELEQIAVTCRGNTCGTVNYTVPKSWITGNAMVINLDKSVIDKRFIYYQLTNQNLNYLISGSGQPQITGNIKKHKMLIPSDGEQRAISLMLDELNQKVDLITKKLEKAKEFKKGLLQQMFA